MVTKGKLVSLIIPAYRQEKTISNDLQRIKNVLDQLRYDYEMIVVVDGKVDKTYENARKLQSKKLYVIGYENNRGKGYAVRFGMAKAHGEIIAFLDSGMDINPNGISLMLEHFEWYNADIIIGSKLHPVSKVNYPWQRRVLSSGYRILTRILFGLKVRDTQVGIKFFKRKVLEDVLPRLLVKNYAFDIEMLAVSYHLGYRRIYEAPVDLDFSGVSSIATKNFWKTIWLMLIDTFAVFYRLKILKYYDSKNKRKWRYDSELDYRINLP